MRQNKTVRLARLIVDVTSGEVAPSAHLTVGVSELSVRSMRTAPSVPVLVVLAHAGR
jgi:hypothetical protein